MAKKIYETYQQSSTASDLIYLVARHLRQKISNFFKKAQVDLSPEQWRLLLQLAEKNGQQQSEFADPILNDRPNITRIIDGLEKRGFLARSAAPCDRRSTLIYLTHVGKELINTYLPEVIEEISIYFEGLNEKDVSELKRIMTIIETNLKK